MDTLIWIVQIILSIKLVTVLFTHGLRQSQPAMQEAIQKMGSWSRPMHTLIAVLALTACAGLILPEVLNVLPGATSGSAVAVCLLMLLSVPFHLRSRRQPNVFAALILGALAAFVAYGRWVPT